MAKYKTYTDEFKKAMVQKILVNPGRSVKSVRIEAGIAPSTLRNWKDKYYLNRGPDLSKNRTNKIKPKDKFNTVILATSMSEDEKSDYCRTHGLYPEEIERVSAIKSV